MMVAGSTNLELGVFTHFIQNMHIYDRHIPVAKEMLRRPDPIHNPSLVLIARENFYDYEIDDFSVIGYEPEPQIGPIEIAI